MPKRKYTKKSDYWDQFNKKDINELIAETRGVDPEWSPTLAGNSYYTQSSLASYERSGSDSKSMTSRTNMRSNRATSSKKF